MNEQIVKRTKALLWSSGMMALAFFIDALAGGLVGLDIPGWLIISLGLIFAQVSKYLNNLSQNS